MACGLSRGLALLHLCLLIAPHSEKQGQTRGLGEGYGLPRVGARGWVAVRKTLSRVLILALAPAEGSACPDIWQYPRFMAKKRGSTVAIMCFMDGLGNVNWLRKQATDSEPKLLHLEQGHIEQTQSNFNATLTIRNIQFQDNGIYFCQQESLEGSRKEGCGTELRVMGGFGACPSGREWMGPLGIHRATHSPPHVSRAPARRPRTAGGGGPGAPRLTNPIPPPPRVQHLGAAETAKHTERRHHHDPDPAHHHLHHRPHLPAAGQGDLRGPGRQPQGRPVLAEGASPPTPESSCLTQADLPGPPGPGPEADGVGGADILFSPSCPTRMTTSLEWRKITPTR